MDAFVQFLFRALQQFFGGIWKSISNIFIGIFDMVNFPKYVEFLSEGKDDLGVGGWILAILVLLVLLAIFLGLCFLAFLGIRKLIRIFKGAASKEALLAEVGKLNAEVIRLSREKDRILQLQTGKIDGKYIESVDGDEEEGENDNKAKAGESRFIKLSKVDEEYANYDGSAENFDNEITLDQICDRFRNFACSRMGLFYEIRVIRLFLAAFSTTRLVILQGISGTGKTSLPYAWGKFLQNDTLIASVQPSWRDRTELFGYFNEFTKRFNETETLKRMYEATYTDKIYLTILDEMNIARVEYYFAEMLSILEMPSRDEWIIDLVPSAWPSDPKHIVDGRFKLPPNMWYVGTANNDDSTFAISDKVYDRAIPINIDSKGVKFDAPDTEPLHVSSSHVEELLTKAKAEHKVSQDVLNKVEILDNYVIEHFRLAFGNRIVKQLREFVPAYVGCGGTEIDGLDYVLANKIFRKFEGLNLTFIRDEIDGLVEKLSELFGEENMGECKAYLGRLKKMV